MSEIFDLGSSFYFMKCRKLHLGVGVHTNAYKGGGGSEHDQKYAFCMHVY